MKRLINVEGEGSMEENKNKKVRVMDEDSSEFERGFVRLDENLLYEVFKHADARTLARASCVNKLWHNTAQDERLWELMCTRHWSNNVHYGTLQLRSVVLALGGFRRFFSLYLCNPASSSAVAPPLPACVAVKGGRRWGKDEVNLSLSLFSIRFYEKMNFTKRSK